MSWVADVLGALGVTGRDRGLRQISYALEDVLRATEQGIRSFLVADLGLLRAVTQAQAEGSSRLVSELAGGASGDADELDPAADALGEEGVPVAGVLPHHLVQLTV
jgi:hypothetical protein